MWQNLRLDIAQEFANPWFIELSLKDLRYAHGLSLDAPQRSVLTRKTDEQFNDLVKETMQTQYTWTAAELAKAVGAPDEGAEHICGRLLNQAGWRSVQNNGRDAWVNLTSALEWFQGRSYVSLRDASRHIGVGAKVLAPVLREAGWRETRRGPQRVWVPAGVAS